MSLNNNLNLIEHQQLRYSVADRLRTAIVEGELPPGEWLRQERLAQQYGVSQMPVREALKQLAAEGLVEHVPYRGVRVVAFSPEDVEDLYAHRAFLEGRAARAAAVHISETELAELRTLFEQMRQRMAPELVNEYRRLNRRFHQVIATASHHEYLTRTLEQLWVTFPNMLLGTFPMTAAHPLPQRETVDVAEHSAILQALLQRDAVAAEQAMQAHIEAAGQHLLKELRGME